MVTTQPATTQVPRRSAVGREEASSTPDWEAIKLTYRAGVLSVCEIAKQHGITHGAVRKRAARDGWERDLSAKVRKAVSTQLVSTSVSTVAPVTERAAIEAAAATVVNLVREHRRDIAGQRSLAETLTGQLEGAIGTHEPLEEMTADERARQGRAGIRDGGGGTVAQWSGCG